MKRLLAVLLASAMVSCGLAAEGLDSVSRPPAAGKGTPAAGLRRFDARRSHWSVPVGTPDDDPDRYWDPEELGKVPAYREAGFPESEYKGLKAILYEGYQPTPGHPESVFAYLGRPDGPVPEGGFPGIVLVHGGGGTAFGWGVDLWRSYGYVVVAMDWYNQRPVDPKGDRRADLPGGRRQNHIVNVANMVRAHSLLRSLPDVDPDRTAFIGLSWGSWYGAMVAAVDPRFRCAVEIYCGDYRPRSDAFINGRFLHAARIPMYWIAGTNDQNVTPASLQAAFDRCPTIWSRSLVVGLPHSHAGYRFQACRRVADHFLRGGVSLPRLDRGRIADGVLSARILDPGKGVKDAVLCYTCDRGVEKTHLRKWHSVPAAVEGGTISARLPPKVFQAYLSLYDDDLASHCCGSTDVFTLP